MRALFLLLFALPAAAGPGPLPDYAPLAQVRSHLQARDLAPEFIKRLTQIAGGRHVVVGGESDTTFLIWMRDYQPVYIRDREAQPRALQMRSPIAERNGHSFPGDPPRTELPMVLEHGNLVVVGRRIFLTERFLEDNQVDGPAAAATRRSVMRELARVLERSEEDIVIMPQMPGEGTGHVDLYLLATSDDTVLVPRISEESLVDLTENEWLVGRAASAFLDEQASFLGRLGLTVKRLPMLPPRVMQAVDNSTDVVVFFSPANALLLNIEGRRTVLLPDLDPSTLRSSHRRLLTQYRKQWAQTFQSLGWKPIFADATELSRYLGFFRCLTAVMPE